MMKGANQAESLATTPADFALLGHCKKFSADCDYSKQKVEAEIQSYLKDKYDLEEIEYVNVAWDIGEIYEVAAELE